MQLARPRRSSVHPLEVVARPCSRLQARSDSRLSCGRSLDLTGAPNHQSRLSERLRSRSSIPDGPGAKSSCCMMAAISPSAPIAALPCRLLRRSSRDTLPLRNSSRSLNLLRVDEQPAAASLKVSYIPLQTSGTQVFGQG